MERYFKFNDVNTWLDWDLIVTSKNITPPEPKTNYVDLDGMSGTLDLSETLTGETTYADRTISASFWTDTGTRDDRTQLIRKIIALLHGKKVKIIEPDDPSHYFYGRVKIKDYVNNLAYLEFSIEATCEPWRYFLTDTLRTVTVTNEKPVDVVFNNHGVKTLCPGLVIDGAIHVSYGDVTNQLYTTGEYKISDIKFKQGVTVVRLSGNGTMTFTYREADL